MGVTLIGKTQLSTTSTSVTFTGIPNSYKDLIIKISARTNQATNTSPLSLRINGDTSSLYSRTSMSEYGSSMYYDTDVNGNRWYLPEISGTTTSANSFASQDIYIANYNSTSYHTADIESANEDFTTVGNNWLNMGAFLYRASARLSSIEIYVSGYSFVANSNFYLYGVG